MTMADFEEPPRLQWQSGQVECKTLGRSHVGALPVWTKSGASYTAAPPTWGGEECLLIPGPILGGWRVLSRIQLSERLTTARAASWGTAVPPVVLPPSPIAQFTDDGHLPNVTARTQRALELCLVTLIRWDTQSLYLPLHVLHGRSLLM